ncbi:MAG: D-alanyl-D-alanine carboxypeptidase family protein [Clostridia bacterium]
MISINLFNGFSNVLKVSAENSSIYSIAKSAVLLEMESGQLVYEKNANEKLPIASTTKIVTALTVIENVDNVYQKVTIPKEAVNVEGSSIYLQEGEVLTVEELLYGMMLQSGNDAATALAIYVATTINDFAAKMNETALKCNAKNSNFVNPHGLHNDKHYSTAKDMALITAEALKNPLFAKIVSTKSISIYSVNGNRLILNKNKLLKQMPDAIGVKTGFTKMAGRCLVAAAKKNGMTFISVVLNCAPMFEECNNMLSTALREYTISNIVNPNQIFGFAKIANNENKIAIASTVGFKYLHKTKDKLDIRTEIIYKNLSKPLNKGSEAGIFNVYISNRLLFSEKLYTIESIN